jgi:hypothetical protein
MAKAVAAGVMSTKLRTMDHDDDWVHAARAAADLSAEKVGDAFLASLTSQRLDLRSTLGSYAVARVLPSTRILLGDVQPDVRSAEYTCGGATARWCRRTSMTSARYASKVRLQRRQTQQPCDEDA